MSGASTLTTGTGAIALNGAVTCATTLAASGAVTMTAGTASTTTTTGTAVITGGVGISGALNVGSSATVLGTITTGNGTAAAPGIRLAGEAHGLFRNSSGSLGFSVAGVGTMTLFQTGGSFRSWLALTGSTADLTLPAVVGLTSSDVGSLRLLGGGSFSAALINIYGNAHATKPNNVEVCTASGTVRATWDNDGHLALASGRNFTMAAANFITDTTTGTKIGTATGQKFSFWNATPVIQPTAVVDAAGGGTIDAEARTALNALLARLRTVGMVAT